MPKTAQRQGPLAARLETVRTWVDRNPQRATHAAAALVTTLLTVIALVDPTVEPGHRLVAVVFTAAAAVGFTVQAFRSRSGEGGSTG